MTEVEKFARHVLEVTEAEKAALGGDRERYRHPLGMASRESRRTRPDSPF
jgi:hypothetical protein